MLIFEAIRVQACILKIQPFLTNLKRCFRPYNFKNELWSEIKREFLGKFSLYLFMTHKNTIIAQLEKYDPSLLPWLVFPVSKKMIHHAKSPDEPKIWWWISRASSKIPFLCSLSIQRIFEFCFESHSKRVSRLFL